MPKPLKVRRSHEIVGLFVLLALGIALAALLLGPQTQRWFTASQNLAIHLPPEGSLGLREGGDVQILGSVVGTVENIVVTDAGKVEAVVSIRGNFFRFVRQDSQAIIRRPLGIGEASIEITRGHGAPLPARGGFLDAVARARPNSRARRWPPSATRPFRPSRNCAARSRSTACWRPSCVQTRARRSKRCATSTGSARH